MPETPATKTTPPTDYDDFAAAYAQENETGLFNAHYARPEILRLAGDVAGRRVLDAGCGSGPLAADLRDRGASVTGFDLSAAMVDLARERLGADADLHVADLAAPLPFDDGVFDDVVASLVLHYLEDWTGPLTELRRVLKPSGRLLVSVNHPAAYAIVYPESDYFVPTQYSEDYDFAGQTAILTFWHRPLHAMSEAFAEAGFRIAAITEPRPAPDTPPELLPPPVADGSYVSFICFLFFSLEAV
ncbi:methyltransferase domain-containing protein [Nocardioides sp. HDW12B]|uniref:class I SAM-dependent methyltransferase n=1 Tax=Nocardioides sp. HDW12B TaxID=2714939 RepID=UPI0014080D5A|nr:class I SAM-dependent methyltransferase [Nocardioides sp. HDW12B]QIK66258.1 methyltransferase domain-containing protein [Nocardioides sp. HDW12B]